MKNFSLRVASVDLVWHIFICCKWENKVSPFTYRECERKYRKV